MADAAQRFFSFKALPQSDRHEVLVSLLRLRLDAEHGALSEEELLHAADLVFIKLDRAEHGR